MQWLVAGFLGYKSGESKHTKAVENTRNMLSVLANKGGMVPIG